MLDTTLVKRKVSTKHFKTLAQECFHDDPMFVRLFLRSNQTIKPPNDKSVPHEKEEKQN